MVIYHTLCVRENIKKKLDDLLYKYKKEGKVKSTSELIGMLIECERRNIKK